MSEYAPTRDEVRETYQMSGDGLDFKRRQFERISEFDRWYAAEIAKAKAEQEEIDLAMHRAYRPEVVAEVAVYLGDDADWEGIAEWCGGTIGGTQDPSGEYSSFIEIPGLGAVAQGMWIVKRHDGTFAVRTVIEEPSEQSIAGIKAEALREWSRVFAEGEWNDAFTAGDVCDDVSAVRATEKHALAYADEIEREAGL